MPTAQAQVTTERPSRYLVQLCKHAGKMGGGHMTRMPAHFTAEAGTPRQMPKNITAEWSETQGTVSIDGGRCSLEATSDALLLRAEADDEERLRLIQEMISRNLTRFSRRDPLIITWRRFEPPSPPPGDADVATPAPTEYTPAHNDKPPAQGRRRSMAVVVVIGVLAIAAHVTLVSGVLNAAPKWPASVADVVLALVVVKLLLMGGVHLLIGRFILRRRKAVKTRNT